MKFAVFLRGKILLKISSADFYRSYSKFSDISNSSVDEYVFLGRSNVGKSSLINDLCGRKIAFASNVPGKTRLINYFTINNSFYFVDLPGYGYAKVSKNEKKNWAGLIEEYLSKQRSIKAIFFLLDIRREPNRDDHIINDWIKKVPDIETFYVLTKYDKLSKAQADRQKNNIALSLLVDRSKFQFYSVLKKVGKTDLLKKLSATVREK